MQYNLEEIEYIATSVLHGYKADANVLVKIKLKSAVEISKKLLLVILPSKL